MDDSSSSVVGAGTDGSSGERVRAKRQRVMSAQKACEALAKVESMAMKAQQEKDLNDIIKKLKEHPELIQQVKHLLSIDFTKAAERLYRGVKSLLDVPFKCKTVAVARAMNWEKSTLLNLPDMCSDTMSMLFYWGAGKQKSWKLPSREMLLDDFYVWYCGLHNCAGRPLCALRQASLTCCKTSNCMSLLLGFVVLGCNRCNGVSCSWPNIIHYIWPLLVLFMLLYAHDCLSCFFLPLPRAEKSAGTSAMVSLGLCGLRMAR